MLKPFSVEHDYISYHWSQCQGSLEIRIRTGQQFVFEKRIIVISESTFEKGLKVQDHIQNKGDQY